MTITIENPIKEEKSPFCELLYVLYMHAFKSTYICLFFFFFFFLSFFFPFMPPVDPDEDLAGARLGHVDQLDE